MGAVYDPRSVDPDVFRRLAEPLSTGVGRDRWAPVDPAPPQATSTRAPPGPRARESNRARLLGSNTLLIWTWGVPTGRHGEGRGSVSRKDCEETPLARSPSVRCGDVGGGFFQN